MLSNQAFARSAVARARQRQPQPQRLSASSCQTVKPYFRVGTSIRGLPHFISRDPSTVLQLPSDEACCASLTILACDVNTTRLRPLVLRQYPSLCSHERPFVPHDPPCAPPQTTFPGFTPLPQIQRSVPSRGFNVQLQRRYVWMHPSNSVPGLQESSICGKDGQAI